MATPVATGRPLLAPDEVDRLPADRLLVLPLGHAPILGERVPYFRDPEMKRRVAAGQAEDVELERFDHDWSHWTGRQVAQRPTKTDIAIFLKEWKKSGAMKRPTRDLKVG